MRTNKSLQQRNTKAKWLFILLLLLLERKCGNSIVGASLYNSPILFILFFFLVFFSSCFSGQASGQYFYRHHFFFFWLETCLWLALRAREKKKEEGGTGWFIARNWQLQQFWQLTQKRKKRLAALLFRFFLSFFRLVCVYFFTDVSVQPPSTSLRSFLFFWLIIRNNHHNGHIPGPASAARFPRQIFLFKVNGFLLLVFLFWEPFISSSTGRRRRRRREKEKKGAGYVVCYCVYACVWKRPVCYTR